MLLSAALAETHVLCVGFAMSFEVSRKFDFKCFLLLTLGTLLRIPEPDDYLQMTANIVPDRSFVWLVVVSIACGIQQRAHTHTAALGKFDPKSMQAQSARECFGSRPCRATTHVQSTYP